jgi:anti-anti-sigma factor
MALSARIEEDQAGSLCVRVEGDLTVQQASELKACLLEALNRARLVRIDLSGVEDMDLTCLQLLCSAHKTALATEKKLVLENDGRERFGPLFSSAGFPRSKGCAMDVDTSCLWMQRRQP